MSAAELRLAGDLLEDLEDDRLDDREAARRMAAFGLESDREYAALLAVPRNGLSSERLRDEVAEELERGSVPYLSTARRDRAAFLVGADSEQDVMSLARRVVEAEPMARVGVGRPSQGRGLGRSLLEARAALDAGTGEVASYQDLGSLELLLSLPDAALEAFVDRVLGPAASNTWLVDSLTALLDAGCRWSDAADELGVHRHTLRYRMDRLREQTGRHPDDPRAAHGALAGREGPAGPRRPQWKEHELTTTSTDHLWRHFTAAGAPQLVIERGEGCYIWDNEGNRYLDALSALYCVNIGYGPWPGITEAAQKQLDRFPSSRTGSGSRRRPRSSSPRRSPSSSR